MNSYEILFEQTQELLEYNLDEAKEKLLELRRSEETPEKNYFISRLLIDFGLKTNEVDYFNEAIGKLKKLIGTDFPSIHFFLGNAYLMKYTCLKEKPDYLNDGEKLLYNAKLEFKREIDNHPHELVHGARINLASIYNMIGRTIEALEIFNFVGDEVGSIYGLYNKGYALYTFTLFTDDPKLYIKEAYNCFKIVSQNSQPQSSFKEKSDKMINLIIGQYGKEFLEEESVDDEIIEVPESSDFEFFMINYCFENKLNLNLCDFCQNCHKSIEDSLLIEKLIYQEVKDDETLFSKLSSYLNQIKMDYVSARTLLILSEYKNFDLDIITKHVYIIDTDFPEMNDIRTQLLKDSFKNFFNILDKIAFFIKDYLGFEDKYDKIYFKTLWSIPEIKDELIQKSNPGITALYDIYLDVWQDFNKKYLRDTRNILTHKYLKVTSKKQEITDKTLDELKNETIELAHIVKNAIIYLMRFLKINEDKREDELDLEFIQIDEVDL